jgi:hypothetical protein
MPTTYPGASSRRTAHNAYTRVSPRRDHIPCVTRVYPASAIGTLDAARLGNRSTIIAVECDVTTGKKEGYIDAELKKKLTRCPWRRIHRSYSDPPKSRHTRKHRYRARHAQDMLTAARGTHRHDTPVYTPSRWQSQGHRLRHVRRRSAPVQIAVRVGFRSGAATWTTGSLEERVAPEKELRGSPSGRALWLRRKMMASIADCSTSTQRTSMVQWRTFCSAMEGRLRALAGCCHWRR